MYDGEQTLLLSISIMSDICLSIEPWETPLVTFFARTDVEVGSLVQRKVIAFWAMTSLYTSLYKSRAHSSLVPGFSDADWADKAVGDTSQECAQKHPGTDAEYFHLKQVELEMCFTSSQKLRLERNVRRQIFQKWRLPDLL